MKSIDVNLVTKFIKEFESMSLATHDTGPIDSYIAKRKDSEMSKWDVFIPSVERNLTNNSLKVVDFEIGLEERTCNLHDKYDDCTCIALSHKGKVAGRGVERVGLTTEEIERCINDYKKSRAYEIAQKGGRKIRMEFQIRFSELEGESHYWSSILLKSRIYQKKQNNLVSLSYSRH